MENVLLVRHFETVKNLRNVQGKSSEAELSEHGREQANYLVSQICKYPDFNSVVYMPTPQSEESAKLIAKLTGLPLGNPLTLQPYFIGELSGLNNEDAEHYHNSSFRSLELFRLRVIDATKLHITGADEAVVVEQRILDWWSSQECIDLKRKIVVSSNSILIMLINYLAGHLPTSGRYYCYKINNGASSYVNNLPEYREAYEYRINNSWPDINISKIQSSYGFVQLAQHEPSWGDTNNVCIIFPGYFGNSRHGPYNLYTRLARKLACAGIMCVTFDYLGSGESSPLKRSYDSDLESGRVVVNKYLSEGFNVSLVGHSLGCAVVSRLLSDIQFTSAIALAPLISLKSLSKSLLTSNEVTELNDRGSTRRRGVRIEKDYLSRAEADWINYNTFFTKICVAENDHYAVDDDACKTYDRHCVELISGADHNFSLDKSGNLIADLIEKTILGPQVYACGEII